MSQVVKGTCGIKNSKLYNVPGTMSILTLRLITESLMRKRKKSGKESGA